MHILKYIIYAIRAAVHDNVFQSGSHSCDGVGQINITAIKKINEIFNMLFNASKVRRKTLFDNSNLSWAQPGFERGLNSFKKIKWIVVARCQSLIINKLN